METDKVSAVKDFNIIVMHHTYNDKIRMQSGQGCLLNIELTPE